MSKNLTMVTKKRQESWYQNHRASILSHEYEPFWRCQDVRSSGVKVKVPHFRDCYRVLHLLSMNEMLMYQQLAWNKSIHEIYEQYALPISETTAIAKTLGVQHPAFIDSKTPANQTLDFYCLDKDGSKSAYAVKQESWLDDYRTQEKLAIQEGWCAIHNVNFEIVSSDELKTVHCQNLEFLFYHRRLEKLLFGVFKTWILNFFGAMSDDRFERAAHTIENSANMTGIPFKRAVHFFYHAIWVGLIDFDWHQPLALELSISELEIIPNDTCIKKLR
jgi:hypothetical protein